MHSCCLQAGVLHAAPAQLKPLFTLLLSLQANGGVLAAPRAGGPSPARAPTRPRAWEHPESQVTADEPPAPSMLAPKDEEPLPGERDACCLYNKKEVEIV